MNKVKAFSGSTAEDVEQKINKWVEKSGAKIEGLPALTSGGLGGSAVSAMLSYSGGKSEEEMQADIFQAPKAGEALTDAQRNPKSTVADEFNDEDHKKNENPPVDPKSDILEGSDHARMQLEGKPKDQATTSGDLELEKKKQARAEEKAAGVDAKDSAFVKPNTKQQPKGKGK